MHYIFFLIFKSLFPGNHFNGKKFGCSHPLTKATPFPPDSYTHCLGWLHPLPRMATPFLLSSGFSLYIQYRWSIFFLQPDRTERTLVFGYIFFKRPL